MFLQSLLLVCYNKIKQSVIGRNGKMRIRFEVSKSIYNCNLRIDDIMGTQNFLVRLDDSEVETAVLEIDVCDGDFELTVTPVSPDYESIFNDVGANGWKEKLAVKLGSGLFSMLDKTMLRVACKYRLTGLTDGDTVYIQGQEYVFGWFDKFDFFELIPMMYMFFETSCRGRRFTLLSAYETNRRDVVKSARQIMLLNYENILIYPIQVGRIKRLSKNKKINKTLMKFNTLSDEEREKILLKKEEFFSR